MAVSRERLDQLYNELFDRETGAEDAGAAYWMESGLTGEALRDALIAAAASNPRGQDYVNFQAAQEQFARKSYADRAADVNQIYIELFGRPAEQGGLQYWLDSGLSGEALRDSIAYAGSQNPKQDDYERYLDRQAQLAAGNVPQGYRTYTPEGPPGYFTDFQDQFTAMQEELAALRELLAAQESSGFFGGSATPIGQPGGGQPGMGQPPVGGVTGGGYSYTTPAAPPPMDNPYLAQLPSSPPVGYIPPTPEMLDSYRYQQFYNQSLVPPIDQGIGQLSYFGIPPSQIQASLSGF
jgi:hypothetical protein